MAGGSGDGTWVDHYAVLGFSDATLADELPSRREISRAFRRLALALHPDKQPAGLSEANRTAVEERFAAVSLANEVLQNDELRAAYDAKFLARAREIRRQNELKKEARAMELDLERREKAFAASQNLAQAGSDQGTWAQTAQAIRGEDAAFKRKVIQEMEQMQAQGASFYDQNVDSKDYNVNNKLSENDFYANLLRTKEDEILSALLGSTAS